MPEEMFSLLSENELELFLHLGTLLSHKPGSICC